jgi:exosome complex RNA-binding protein Rrp42 (RNase PH superfamily)
MRLPTDTRFAQAAPFQDRPNEGLFALTVEFSPMASPEFEPGRPVDAAVELSRFLERGLKQSGT